MPTAFGDENFAFFGKTLSGTQEQQPRWKRCVAATDRSLGDALGQLYVAKTFPPSAKVQALDMVHNIEATLRSDFASLDWMTPQTRTKAIQKLDAFTIKIGYPDRWRVYAGLPVGKSSYGENAIAAFEFRKDDDLRAIGKPVDRTRWGLTPPTVNAYYNPPQNEIVFPAGILQPPVYDKDADMAVNYGGIGAVIGHESTHGFDDQGRKYDYEGNLSDWWTPEDAVRFNARASCIVKQFDALSPLPGIRENGSLVQGEAIADLGGVTIAYKAFEKWQAAHPRRVIDGFTPEQRFFLGWAQVWASNERPRRRRAHRKNRRAPLRQISRQRNARKHSRFRQSLVLQNDATNGTPRNRPLRNMVGKSRVIELRVRYLKTRERARGRRCRPPRLFPASPLRASSRHPEMEKSRVDIPETKTERDDPRPGNLLRHRRTGDASFADRRDPSAPAA